MLGAGLPIKVASLDAPGGYDTHDEQAEDFNRHLKETCDGAARLPARPRGARPRRPGGDAGLVGVRAPAGGERLRRDRSRCRRQRLPDRQAGPRARWSASGPASTTLDEDDNLRATSDFRAMYCSLLEGWFGVDAARRDPGRRELLPTGADQMRGCAAGAAARSSRPALAAVPPPSAAAAATPNRPAPAPGHRARVRPVAVAGPRSSRATRSSSSTTTARTRTTCGSSGRRPDGLHDPGGAPGETGRVELRLRKRSRYRLWCSLPNHAELGMFDELRTSGRSQPPAAPAGRAIRWGAEASIWRERPQRGAPWRAPLGGGGGAAAAELAASSAASSSGVPTGAWQAKRSQT